MWAVKVINGDETEGFWLYSKQGIYFNGHSLFYIAGLIGIWKGENNKTVSNIFKLVNCSKPKRGIKPKF